MKPLIVHPAAKAELNEAMDWYEKRVRGLGIDLNEEVSRAFQRAQTAPERCAPHGKSGYRKVFVRRFPYIRILFGTAGDYMDRCSCSRKAATELLAK